MCRWAVLVASGALALLVCARIFWGSDPRQAKRPRIRQQVPKFMLDLYHQSRNGSEVPDVVRSVIPKSSGSYESPDNHYMIFDVPRANEDEDFFSAELRLLTIVDSSESQTMEKLLKLSIYNHDDGGLLYLNRFRIKASNNTWISINLTSAVEALLLRGDNNLRVVLALEALKLSLLVHHEHNYPILLLSYNCRGNQRVKRSLMVLEDDDEIKRKSRYKNGCKRKPLYVDFSEIDYDSWIVQPSGYEAFQCVGKCFYPLTDHLTPTKHAIVQALVHSLSPSKATRSCCVPTRLDPISILYVDERGVLTYRYAYKDMVVAECGCR